MSLLPVAHARSFESCTLDRRVERPASRSGAPPFVMSTATALCKQDNRSRWSWRRSLILAR